MNTIDVTDTTSTEAIKNVTPMTEAEARKSIERINKGVQSLRRELLELQQRRGWESLGYDSWKACCEQEFHSDRRRLNYMLEAASVEFELTEEGIDQGKIFPVPDSQLRELSKAPFKKRKEAFLLLKQWESEDGSVTAKDAEAAVCAVYPNACYNTAIKLVCRFIANGGDREDEKALETIFKGVHPRLKEVLYETVKCQLNQGLESSSDSGSEKKEDLSTAQPSPADIKLIKIISSLNAYRPEQFADALIKNMDEQYGIAILLRLVHLDKELVAECLKEMQVEKDDLKKLSDGLFSLCQHLDDVFDLPIN